MASCNRALAFGNLVQSGPAFSWMACKSLRAMLTSNASFLRLDSAPVWLDSQGIFGWHEG